MKYKFFLLLLITIGFTACGDEAKDEVVEEQVAEVENDSIRRIEGEFIYLADAAVIKGKDFIYGVELDSLSLDLAQRVAPLKQDEFDMIPVVVIAKVIPNPGREGWDEILQIQEVVDISNPEGKKVEKKLPNKDEEQD